ncbi:MAG: DCC1-like thiol-disulfide oxidoreductase family protein [Ilumatobacteraceae bacterium]
MLRRLRRQPRVVAWQDADLVQLGLSAKQCQEAVQWVSSIGGNSREHFSAEDAVAKVLRNAGGLWRVVGVLMMLPGVHRLSGVIYRWIARSR